MKGQGQPLRRVSRIPPPVPPALVCNAPSPAPSRGERKPSLQRPRRGCEPAVRKQAKAASRPITVREEHLCFGIHVAQCKHFATPAAARAL